MIVLSSLELTYNNYIKHINSGQEEDVVLNSAYRLRKLKASARCLDVTEPAPSRSAMVCATFMTLKYDLADKLSLSEAAARNFLAAESSFINADA